MEEEDTSSDEDDGQPQGAADAEVPAPASPRASRVVRGFARPALVSFLCNAMCENSEPTGR